MDRKQLMGTSNQDQELIDRIESIKTLIQKKATREVTLIAVTKGFGYEAISAAQKAGLKHFGENYAQELLTKSQNLHENCNWHFIGQLQTNKVKKISNLVKVWHSVTSIKLAKEIEKRSQNADVLIQVNIGPEGNRMGINASNLPSFLEDMQSLKVNVRGLMTMGAAGDPEQTRTIFSTLRDLADTHELEDCSMGMSGDLEIALECGSTMLRIGTAILGNRGD